MTTGGKEQNQLMGKVAVVTGSSEGIGYNLLRVFAHNGIKAVGCARNVIKIEQLSLELKGKVSGEVAVFKCDVTKEGEIKQLFDFAYSKYGGVDILVNNAGLGHPAPLLSGDTDHWKSMLDVNVLALAVCTREFYQRRVATGIDSGYIININSVMGHAMPDDTPSHFYGVSKHAVSALTEGVRQELRENKSKIKVSQVSPGLVRSDFVRRFLNSEEKAEELFKSSKYLECKDVSDSVIYLLNTPAYASVHDIITNPI